MENWLPVVGLGPLQHGVDDFLDRLAGDAVDGGSAAGGGNLIHPDRAQTANAASTSTGQTTAMGLTPSDFSATTSFDPVMRPKTLLTA